MKQSFAVSMLMASVAGSAFAGNNGPSITFSPPPPDNDKNPITYVCPGDPCAENCVFPLRKLNCTITVAANFISSMEVMLNTSDNHPIVIVTNRVFEADNTNATVETALEVTGYLEVGCGSYGRASLCVIAWGRLEPAETNDLTVKCVDYFFHCVPCATTTRTEGNGHTPTDHSAVNHNVRLGCSVINLDSADHMVDLVAQSTLGWAVSGVPASLLLTNGESVELFPEVTVPAGTPDWKTNLVTITSAFSGIANSTSSDTMDVTVQTPLQFVGIRPLSPGSWLLQLTGPWNALYIIEGSTNLLNWQTAAITQAPVGSGVVFVNVSPGPGAPAQFYRARAASMGP